MPLVLGGSSAAAAAFSVDNSCRFEPGDDPSLTYTPGTPTNNKKWTFSVWIKKTELDVDSGIMMMGTGPSGAYTRLNQNGDGALEFDNHPSGFEGRKMLTALARDLAAWMHYVAVYDSDNGVADDRMMIYVNGTRQTALTTDTDPSSGAASGLASGEDIQIGLNGMGTSKWGGYMAEVALCDGQAYAASDFGEFDEDSPTIWKPKKISTLTFGDEGFYLDFEDSAALGNDVSGNNNDFTVANLTAIDQCTDTPNNNFVILNPLDAYYTNSTFTDGATTFASGSSYTGTPANILLNVGKWYWEINVISKTGDTDNYTIGIVGEQPTATNQFPGYPATGYAIYGLAGQLYNNNSASTYAGAYAAGDLIGIALDLTNNKLYFSKDGAWADGSGAWDSTTFDAAVGDIDITASASTPLGGYNSSQTFWSGSGATFSLNYGNPPYANTSDVADENGYGKFEYTPPSGYLALCTKNLGSDGG